MSAVPSVKIPGQSPQTVGRSKEHRWCIKKTLRNSILTGSRTQTAPYSERGMKGMWISRYRLTGTRGERLKGTFPGRGTAQTRQMKVKGD